VHGSGWKLLPTPQQPGKESSRLRESEAGAALTIVRMLMRVVSVLIVFILLSFIGNIAREIEFDTKSVKSWEDTAEHLYTFWFKGMKGNE
jgi:hypothetical protein